MRLYMRSQRRSDEPATRLLTIPISHYCEKARWALDRAGIPYREERHIQLVHRVAARRAGGERTVPVLVTADEVLADSSAILRFADLHVAPDARLLPEAEGTRRDVLGLERRLDVELGPHGRRWMYFHMQRHPSLMVPYNCAGVPGWERAFFRLAFQPLRLAVNGLLRITARTADESDRRVERVFDAVAGRLDDGRPFLAGERFTAADLTFAALAAAVLVPEGYGVPLPQPAVLPPTIAARVRELRRHPAGAFALRMFAEERR